MTVTVQDPFNQYTANGVTTAFAYEFRILADSHLVVRVNGATIPGNDYSVANGSNGGTVTFDTAPANGAAVFLSREVPLSRVTDYTTNGPFPASTVNADFDLIWMVLQVLGAYRDGSLRVPYPATINDMPSKATLAGRLLAFDGSGEPEESSVTMTQIESVVAAIYAAAAGPLDALSFIQSGTGAQSRSAQGKARDIVSVFDFMTAAQIADAQAFTYTQDLTTAINTNALTAAAGKMLYFPEAGYLSGRLLPLSNTTLWFDPGCVLRKKTNGTQCLKIADKQNVHIRGNGCTFDGQTNADATSGDTVNISDSQHCSMHDVHVLGAGTNGQDCIYIGSDGNDEACEDIVIRGGSCTAAKRNGISVVAARRVVIDNVEISGTTFVPGAGIDIEANVHGLMSDVEIKHCKIYGNAKWGIVNIFGSGVDIHHNTIYNNGDAGIAASAGGMQFNNTVARTDIDWRALSAVNIATGELTVSGFSALEVGTIVTPRVRNGGVLPTGLTAGSLYFVYSKSGGNIILATLATTPITSFAGAGSGTLTTNPATSDWYLLCYESGQSSELDIHHNVLYGNNQVRGQIDILSSVNVRVWENEMDAQLDQSAMSFTYCRNVWFARNRCNGNVAGTSATARGIHAGTCTNVASDGNEVAYFPGPGVNLSNMMLPGTFKADVVTNCGMIAGRLYALENMDRARVENLKLRSDPAYPATNGLQTISAVTNTLFSGVDAKGTGSSNATSMAVSGSGNRYEDCIQYDGTYYLTGSATYDPALIAAGAGADASAITVTGAALGDFAEASFSLNTQGIDLIARVSAANTVTVRFQNGTAAGIDLASGTLRVRVRKP